MAATTNSDVTYRDEAKGVASTLGTLMRQTWWLGLGILATVGEQTAQLADALVQKGREVEPSMVKPVRQAAAGLAEVAQNSARLVTPDAIRNVRMPSMLRRTGGPTKEEFEQLAEEVRSLRQRLGEEADE